VLYTFSASIRWLSIRLDCLAVSVTGVTALLIVMFHGNVTAAAAGLALAYAAQFSGVFQFTVRLASETEAKFVSMERWVDIHKTDKTFVKNELLFLFIPESEHF
jgi:ATP-binding cassette subfamily C (CFTR/MRP) protein 5